MTRRAQFASLVCALAVAACSSGDGGPDPMVIRSGGDLLAGGTALELADSVPGDVMAGGRTVRFFGATQGSYLGLGGDLDVSGRVDGSLRAVAGRVIVSTEVGRNVTVAAQELVVDRPAVVRRNAYLIGGHIVQRGTIEGHLRVAGGAVELDGVVGGNVHVIGESLTIGPNARIAGDVTYRVDPTLVKVDPAATLGGDLKAMPPGRRLPPGFGLLLRAIRLLAFLLLGVVVVALFPRTTEGAAGAVSERALQAFGMGLVTVLLAPVLVAVSAATIVGIPLALVAFGSLLVALYLAPVIPSLWLGGVLLEGRPGTSAVVKFVTGGVLVGFAILLPWIGWPVRVVATCFGVGAVALRLRGS